MLLNAIVRTRQDLQKTETNPKEDKIYQIFKDYRLHFNFISLFQKGVLSFYLLHTFQSKKNNGIVGCGGY